MMGSELPSPSTPWEEETSEFREYIGDQKTLGDNIPARKWSIETGGGAGWCGN